MKRKLIFSVVIPNYNCEKYIEKAINSILIQRGDFFIEIIVMDGKSKDKSVEIVKKIKKRLENKKIKINCLGIKLKYFSEKDEGQTDAINKGFNKCKGDIICYLNSDDEYFQNAFRYVSEKYSINKTTWYTGKAKVIDAFGNIIRKPLTHYRSHLLKFMNKRTIFIENCLCQPSTFWSRKHFKEIGQFNKSLYYCMDYEYHIRSFNKKRPIIINHFLSKMRYIETRKSANYLEHTNEHHIVTKKYTKNKIIHFLDYLNLKKRVLVFNLWDKISK